MAQTTTSLIDGEALDHVPLDDRGLLYGDGLFETLPICRGMPLLWQEHARRLRAGCERLSISMPDPARLDADIRSLSSGVERAVLRVTITRGGGGRGYRFSPTAKSRTIVTRHPWPDGIPERARRGIALRQCRIRLAQNAALAGIKHLNRLEQVMARAEWSSEEIAEGLMLDTGGHVIEGTMSNLFLVSDGHLTTPNLRTSGIRGIMREKIKETAHELGTPAQERPVTMADLDSSTELFVCNSVIGIWPVIRHQQTTFPIGPLTTRLQEVLARLGVLAYEL